MSRNVSRGFLGSLLILFAASLQANSADRTPKESAATAAARKQVEAALEAEAAGDNDRRAELLAGAIQSASALPEANWHLARVHVSGKWLALADAEQHAASDPLLAEYRKLRDEAGENPKQIRGLARWCLKNGWEDTARLHFGQILSTADADLDAKQEALRKLDLQNVGGNWMTGKEFAEHQRKLDAVQAALAKWRPRIKRIQLVIDGNDIARREYALKELATIDDPRIVPVLESFLVDGGDRFQEEAIRRLAGYPHYEATEALVYFAVLSPFLSARDAASAALRSRSVFEYCPLLLGGLIAPLKLQYEISADRSGKITYTQAVRRETPQVSQLVVTQDVAIPGRVRIGFQSTSAIRAIMNSTLVQTQADLFRDAATAAALEVNAANSNVDAPNRRIMAVLSAATGEQLPSEPEQWWEWWQDYNQKWLPKVSQYSYGQQQRYYPGSVRHSCFVAGTLVHTETGFAPIETIKPGDRVLSQDQDSGELAYKVISARTIRPPGKLLRIHVDDESITATLGHPFWVSGSGWRMAKELRTGDRLHALGGSVQIDQIDELPEPQQAYNLVVQDFNAYFVGKTGLLVHDNEFRKPTRAIVPGLTEEAVAKK